MARILIGTAIMLASAGFAWAQPVGSPPGATPPGATPPGGRAGREAAGHRGHTPELALVGSKARGPRPLSAHQRIQA